MAVSTVRRDAWALGLGTGVFGVSFGALAVTAGLTAWQAQALSLLMFTGGSQYALVGVLAAGGGVVSAGSVALLLGARNTLYGVRLAPLLALKGRWRTAVGAQLVIDETTAMATAVEPGPPAQQAFWTTGVAIFSCWNIGTLLGALAVSLAPDPRSLGLDVAFPAAFVWLLVPRLRTDAVLRRVAALGALIAVLLTPVLPPGVPVLAAVVAVLPAALRATRDRPGTAA